MNPDPPVTRPVEPSAPRRRHFGATFLAGFGLILLGGILIGGQILTWINRAGPAGSDPASTTNLITDPLMLLGGGLALVAGVLLVVFNLGHPWGERVRYTDNLE